MIRYDRLIHIDFHTQPNITDFGANFSGESIAEALASAGAECVNVFARDNQGYCYYPTKTGVAYPHMKGDLFGETLAACHARGIRVMAYFNIAIDHLTSSQHSELCYRDSDGNTTRGDASDAACRFMCCNGDYGPHILSLIREVISLYDIDGIFADNMLIYPCRCDKCLNDMKKAGIDSENDSEAEKAYASVMLRLAEDIRASLPAGKTLDIKGLPPYIAAQITDYFDIPVMPTGGDGFNSFLPQAAYVRQYYENPVYLFGRFQRGWGDFGGYCGRVALENAAYDAILGGAGLMIGDHMHPRDGLDKNLYRDIGHSFDILRRYDEYRRDAVIVPEIAVMRNRGTDLPSSVRGAVSILNAAKYTYDVVDSRADLSRYSAVILTNGVDAGASLDNYRGAILSAGALPDCVAKRLGISEDGCLSDAAYYMFDERTYACYSPCHIISGGELISPAIVPYNERCCQDGRPYFYTPPDCVSGAAICGNGNTRHIAFDIFSAYDSFSSQFHADTVRALLRELIPSPLIGKNDLPRSVILSVMDSKVGRLVAMKITSPRIFGGVETVTEHDVLPAGHIISVSGKYNEVALVGYNTSSEFSYADGYTEISLPQITGFAMIILK